LEQHRLQPEAFTLNYCEAIYTDNPLRRHRNFVAFEYFEQNETFQQKGEYNRDKYILQWKFSQF
jgi:hypothetical protein